MVRLFRIVIPLLMLLGAATANADTLEDIIERGSVRVGVAEFVPWTMKTNDGELVGFEIDVAKKIASDMGVDVEFVVYDWADIIEALNDGDIDVIAGGMAITPQRALKINFTMPTAVSGVGIATNTAMTKDIQSFAELNDDEIIVATVAETRAAMIAETFFDQASVNAFRTVAEAEEEVLNGRAHVYLAGMSEVKFLARRNPDVVDVPVNEPLISQSEALAVRKGEQEWLNFLNAWVTARQTDQWIPTTRDYWFDSMTWAMDDDS